MHLTSEEMLKLRLAVSASMACRIGLCSLSYLPLRPVVWNHTLRQALLIICSFFHFSFFILHSIMFLPVSGCKDTTKRLLCQYLLPEYLFRVDYQSTNLLLFSKEKRTARPLLCMGWLFEPKSVHAESPCEKNSPKIWRFGRKGLPLQQFQRIYIMCTYNITVDEQVIAKISPSVSREDFGALLQLFVDEFVDSLVSTHGLPPRSHTAEEMYAIVKERLHSIESGNAKFVDGESVFESLRARYGFKTQVA